MYFTNNEEIAVIAYKVGQDGRISPTTATDAPYDLANNDKVKVVYIGAHVEQITWNGYRCGNLMNILVEESNPNYTSVDGVLYTKDKKTLVAFPSGRKGDYEVLPGTKTIANFAFKTCKLSNIIIPDSVEVIGENVFYDCRWLDEIVLPDTVKKLSGQNNQNFQSIRQKIYFKSDTQKEHPYTIEQISERIGCK